MDNDDIASDCQSCETNLMKFGKTVVGLQTMRSRLDVPAFVDLYARRETAIPETVTAVLDTKRYVELERCHDYVDAFRAYVPVP